jgi:hypothetical protein
MNKPVMKAAESANENAAIYSISLYPAERVREIFNRMKAAEGTGKEAAELRIFAARMKWLKELFKKYFNTEPDTTWTNAFNKAKKEENVLYPKWG